MELPPVSTANLSCVLELAAINDVDGFKKWIEGNPLSINDVWVWYKREKDSRQLVREERTPLMVAASYGSVDVVKHILSMPEINVNRACGANKRTPLHFAASSGSDSAIEIVEMLLAAGADRDLTDGEGLRAADVLVVCPNLREQKSALKMLLSAAGAEGDQGSSNLRLSAVNSPPVLPSAPSHSDPSSSRNTGNAAVERRREYPFDAFLPSINNRMYTTDEFRMFEFKVRPCSRAYSHDWTACPFAHSGENARRRDPRGYNYTCVPCPEYGKDGCPRGDSCEFAHGVFEIWLHPAQYRTMLCRDGDNCTRRVCFFAHGHHELRPLYASTGPALPSPRSPANAAIFFTGSPSGFMMMPPSPLSPSASIANAMPNVRGWVQPAAPTLFLPSNSPQSILFRPVIHAPESLFIDVAQQQMFDDFYHYGSPSAVFRPAPQPAAAVNWFQQQPRGMMSPVNASFSPFAAGSSGRMVSPRNMDSVLPSTSRATRLRQQPSWTQQFRSRELGSTSFGATGSSSSTAAAMGSLSDLGPNWGSPTLGQPDWTIDPDLARLMRPVPFQVGSSQGTWRNSAQYDSGEGSSGAAAANSRPRISPSALPTMFSGMHLDGHFPQEPM